MMKLKKPTLGTLLLGCCLLATGCGDPGPPDESLIRAQVSGLNDAARSDESFNAHFVAGAAPAEKTPYQTRLFEVVEPPAVNGSQATVKVHVKPGVDSSRGDAPETTQPTVQEAQVQWTLEKVGDAWKLKEAPLS